MGVEDIKARNAELRAKGQLPGAKPADAPPAKAKRVELATCAHLGERVPGQPCGSQLMRCRLHGGTTTRFTKCSGAARHCPTCPDNTTRAADAPANLATAPVVAPVVPGRDTVGVRSVPGARSAPAAPFGVVIGSYGWPALVDLQCRVIRDTCGPVPILVSSDKPEAAANLAAICAAHPDVTLDTNPKRIGHTGGDISAYHKGIKWAADRGMKVVAKLSQRLLITRPQWIQVGAADLLASGLPLASQRCRGREAFDLRTEAVLLDVAQWNKPAVLTRIRPRRYWGDVPGKGLSAERIIYRVLQDLLGGIYWPWALLGESRYTPADGVVWHCSHSRDDYDRLAAKYGVTLPPDFHIAGWELEFQRGEYLYG